nr:MAG TPA: hypothetical protein [Caudoviricetes sp.]
MCLARFSDIFSLSERIISLLRIISFYFELVRITELCTYYTSLYRTCQYFYFVFPR